MRLESDELSDSDLKKEVSMMTETVHNPTDINAPGHRPEAGELLMALFAVVSALATAAVLEFFHPKRPEAASAA